MGEKKVIWFSYDMWKSEISWHFLKDTTKVAVKGNSQVIPLPEPAFWSLIKLAVHEELHISSCNTGWKTMHTAKANLCLIWASFKIFLEYFFLVFFSPKRKLK